MVEWQTSWMLDEGHSHLRLFCGRNMGQARDFNSQQIWTLSQGPMVT
jgi:hypothetical protein